MISTTLPYEPSGNDKVPDLSANSAIYAHSSAKYRFPKHKTPYLLISNFLNKGRYVLNESRIETSERSFYFLNPSDELEMCFDQPLQTLLVLLEERFVKESYETLLTCDKSLLEDQTKKRLEPRTPSVPFEMTKSIRNHIEHLISQTRNQQDFDDQLFILLLEIWQLDREIQSRIEKLKVAKKATQEELYRRIFLAREYMYDNPESNLSLNQVATEVGMSKFHLLSNFKKLFNTTPHRYHTELKLQKALELLKAGNSVSEVCFHMGFESVGSFSNLFKKRFNIRPSAYRPH